MKIAFRATLGLGLAAAQSAPVLAADVVLVLLTGHLFWSQVMCLKWHLKKILA